MDKAAIKQWIEHNLVMQDEARTITGQSVSGFNQSIQTGRIRAFVEFGEARKTRLYLREEMVQYGKSKRIRGAMNEMRIWARVGYEVVEKEFDGDLHEFDVVKDGAVIATITPPSIEDMEQIVADLDDDEDVHGWEDGMGNTIDVK
jgi:hypothetical protein